MPVLFQHQLLTRARVDLGLTQEDAARAVGVDVRTYRRYESGEVNEGGSFGLQRASRRKIVERICRELGIDESELLQSTLAAQSAALGAQASLCLPRAQHFVGRVEALAQLRVWLADIGSTARVVALVAMGGAGKTSLVERALSSEASTAGPASTAGLASTAGPASTAGLGTSRRAPFVFSFYEQASVDVFLQRAAVHLGQSGGEALDDVLCGLRRYPAATLVLDGLEVVQADGEGERARGELVDRRLLRLLRAVVREPSLGRVLLTSRFALPDLAAYEGQQLQSVDLPQLSCTETQSLLAQWGLAASSTTLSALHEQTGGHALSLAVVGAYASELLAGDVALASGLALADAARDQPLARRLQLLLDRYAAELVAPERTLLGTVCIFPRGATIGQLLQLPGVQGSQELELRAGLGRLVRRGLIVLQGERYTAHSFIRGHFAGLAGHALEIHAQERKRLGAELEGQPEHRLHGALLDRAEQLFEHTLLAGDVDAAYRVLKRTMGGFAHLGLRLGEFERGLRLVRALERVQAKLPADAQWRVTYDRGLYAAALGDLDAAVQAYRVLLKRNDEDATTHRTLAYTLRLRGELELAHRHVERSIELGRAEKSPGTVARGLALRGALLTTQTRLDEARAAFDEARALGDTLTARRAIWEAEYFLARGELERATALTLENLEACQGREWAGHVAHCHVILGRAALRLGALESAEHALDAALDWCRRSKEVELTLETQWLELKLARVCGDVERQAQVRGTLLDAAIAGGYGAIAVKVQLA